MENYQNSGGVEIMTIKLITDWLISCYETGYLSYSEIKEAILNCLKENLKI